MVVEVRRTGGEWFTWAGADLMGIPEDAVLETFTQVLKARHDSARMQFRLVSRTAVITGEILAEEHPDGLVTTYHEEARLRVTGPGRL